MQIIYALVDKRDPLTYRYVGHTGGPLKKRLHEHEYDARKRPYKTRRLLWIREVLAAGSRINFSVLDEVAEGMEDFKECMWIAALREAGYPLTNETDGGIGFTDGGARFSRHPLKEIFEGKECTNCDGLFSGWPYKTRAKRKTCSEKCRAARTHMDRVEHCTRCIMNP